MEGYWITLFLSLCLSVTSLNTKNFYGPKISVSSHLVKMGDNVTITCSVYQKPPGYNIQLMKIDVPVVHPSGKENSSTPVKYVMSTNGQLSEAVAATGRYIVTETTYQPPSETTGYRYIITITDSKPLDTGTFQCRGLYDLEGKDYFASGVETVYVEGPIRQMAINYPPVHLFPTNEDISTGNTYPDPSAESSSFTSPPLNLTAGEETEIECAVTVGHQASNIDLNITFGDRQISEVILDDYGMLNVHILPGKFVDAKMILYYLWKMTPSLKDSGKELKCNAILSHLWPSPFIATSEIIVTGPPESAQCHPDVVEMSGQHQVVMLNCSAYALVTEDLAVTWQGPTEELLYDFITQRDGLRVTSVLIVSYVTNYGMYRVTWSDQMGSTSAQVELKEIITDAGMKESYSVLCTILQLILTLCMMT